LSKLSFFILALFSLGAGKLSALTLTVWDRPPVARPQERQIWDAEAADFESSYKSQTGQEVHVNGISRQYIQQQFVTVMAGGKGPDVVHVWVGALPTLAREGLLAPMDKEVESWDQKDLIPDLFWEPARTQAGLIGIPCDSYFYTLLIRRDLWIQAGLDPEHPPATWDELAEDAKKLTKPASGQIGFGFMPDADMFLDFVWQAGGELLRKDASGAWGVAFQENPGVTALNYLHELRFKYGVMQPNPLAKEDELKQLFALGKLAMMPGVANQMPDLITRFGMKPEDLIIAPLPAGPTGIHASHSGGDYYIVNAQASPAVKQAAWAYIRHALSPLNQLGRWDQMKKLNMPVFPGAFSVSTDLVNKPEFKLVKDALAYARTEPHVENWPRIKDYLESMVLERALTDESADAAQLLNDAADSIRANLL
jgi:ABC-type glycerol-3-phosphate transport system substrate-binding protein